MAGLKSGVILGENETVIAELEAELWATSSNPIAQAIGGVQRILSAILGFKHKGFVVITNKRVIETYTKIKCYVFNTGKKVTYLLPSSIKEISYSKEATFGLFCPAYHLEYDAFTQSRSILLKDADEDEAAKITNAFYSAIAKANE